MDITEQVKIMAQQIARLESRVAELERSTIIPTTSPCGYDADFAWLLANPDKAKEYNRQKAAQERARRKKK